MAAQKDARVRLLVSGCPRKGTKRYAGIFQTPRDGRSNFYSPRSISVDANCLRLDVNLRAILSDGAALFSNTQGLRSSFGRIKYQGVGELA